MELQSRLRIRLAELGFHGVPAANVVHHLAEIAALAQEVAQRTKTRLTKVALGSKWASCCIISTWGSTLRDTLTMACCVLYPPFGVHPT